LFVAVRQFLRQFQNFAGTQKPYCWRAVSRVKGFGSYEQRRLCRVHTGIKQKRPQPWGKAAAANWWEFRADVVRLLRGGLKLGGMTGGWRTLTN
jgi:hypothetical protein